MEDRMSLRWFLVLSLFPLLYSHSFAAQWINPKDLIGDPNLARLQQGRKELTAQEKEEIKRYGFTGLELMTYVQANKESAHDFDMFVRLTTINSSGIIQVKESVHRWRYCLKNYKAKLTLNGVKPGDKEYQRTAFLLLPPKLKGYTFMFVTYVKTKDMYKERTSWSRLPTLRRIRRDATPNRQDKARGTDMTFDDLGITKQPWEENYRILGEDVLRGIECLVVEGKMWFIPNYYLSKRVVWVDKKNFLDIHEEQFDREGKLFKIMDKEWIQVKPWNYWEIKTWYMVDLSTKSKTFEQHYGWIFDQGLTENDFSTKILMNDRPWRLPKNPPPFIEKPSDFPPEPKVRWKFWDSLGVRPEVYK